VKHLDIEALVFFILIFLLVVLFAGEPDLHDALLKWAFSHAICK
jgi:hypothetical protein